MQFEEMNQAIDAYGIKPMVDEKVFGLEELKEAYQYMVSRRVFIDYIILLIIASGIKSILVS